MDAKSLYRQQTVETASPAQLVSMLFHGAIARTTRAEEHLLAGELGEANAQLQHVQEMVFALRSSLDFERGGEIAQNLSSLYGFCIERLIEANTTKDPSLLEAVRTTLAGLVAAWDEMVAAGSPSAVPPPPPPRRSSGVDQVAGSR